MCVEFLSNGNIVTGMASGDIYLWKPMATSHGMQCDKVLMIPGADPTKPKVKAHLHTVQVLKIRYVKDDAGNTTATLLSGGGGGKIKIWKELDADCPVFDCEIELPKKKGERAVVPALRVAHGDVDAVAPRDGADAGLEPVNAALEDGQLGFEFLEQATQLIGHFSDPVEAGVQQGSRFIAGHRPVAAEGAVGITGDAAVGLHQIGQSLIGPVGGVDVRKLADAGDLIKAVATGSSRVIRNAVDVQLGGMGCWAVDNSQRGQKAKSSRSHQQLLDKLHDWEEIKKTQR